MTQELRATMVPALPAPRLTADIYETVGGEAYVIEIPVPGLTPDEIVVEADSYSLTVSTEPQQAEPNSDRRYIQREQPVRPLSRLFEFPVEIDTDNVRTTLESGILKIYVPKAAVGRRKVIRVGQPV
jgi:HSP20 family protein